MSAAPSQLGAFTRSDPGRNHANIEFHVQPLSLDAFGEPLHAFPAITASVCNLNPTSRGRVEIASGRAADAPLIRPNYLATEEDRKVAADSLRVTRRICAQPALAPYAPVEWKPGVEFESDAELARLAGDIATTIFHPVGTTAMGRDGDAGAVLDPRMRMRDGQGGRIAGLRVVDAGAMPLIVSGNTNAPVLDDGGEGGTVDQAGGVIAPGPRPLSRAAMRSRRSFRRMRSARGRSVAAGRTKAPGPPVTSRRK